MAGGAAPAAPSGTTKKRPRPSQSQQPQRSKKRGKTTTTTAAVAATGGDRDGVLLRQVLALDGLEELPLDEALARLQQAAAASGGVDGQGGE